MKPRPNRHARAGLGLLLAVLIGPILLRAESRFQVELYGGFSLLNPKDLNLFSSAEEEYNRHLLQERYVWYLGYPGEPAPYGYFIDEFPRIWKSLPAGFRVKCFLSPSLSFSLSLEAFRQAEEASPSGTFTQAPNWELTESRSYDRFRLGIEGLSFLGGLHYSLPVGRNTRLEAGLQAGWTWASFDFLSSWTTEIDLIDETGMYIVSSRIGHSLEGDGRGNGFAARASVRLNRALGDRWGFFIEAAASYDRIKSLRGGGRESFTSLPGATTWEGEWGVKTEDIVTSWSQFSVSVPTNYWESWVGAQRERDFVLDLSALGCGLGIYYRF